MAHLKVTATELARNLSSYLSQVRYQSVSVEVWRGRQMVALLHPPGASSEGFPIGRLNAFVASLPRLEQDDAQAFLEELDRLGQTSGAADDPWDL